MDIKFNLNIININNIAINEQNIWFLQIKNNLSKIIKQTRITNISKCINIKLIFNRSCINNVTKHESKLYELEYFNSKLSINWIIFFTTS